MLYDDLLLRLGGFGKYQKRLLAILIIPPFLDPLTSYTLTFILGEHKYRCQIPDNTDVFYNIVPLNQTWNVSECFLFQNGTEVECKNWLYDQSQYTSTLISSFDMVCDNKFLRSHMMLCHYIGLFFGSFICGVMCDTIGRRPTLSISLLGMFLPNVIRSFVHNIPLVGILNFANGFFSNLLYQSAYILVTELVDKSKRVFTNFLLYFSFCIGEYAVLLFAYFIRDWRYLGWATSVPVGISFIIVFFIQESPRWLVAKGKLKQAEVIFGQIKAENGVNMDIDVKTIHIQTNKNRNSFIALLKILLAKKVLLRRWAILCFNWFAVAMTYFGITMKVGNLGGNVYINFLVSTTAEVAALFICLFVSDRLGRKRVFCSAMFVCAICCLCTIFTSLFADDSLHLMTIALAMVGKLAISVAFFKMYPMVSESFPTVLRSFTLGICAVFGRVGAMLSAYIGDLGVLVHTRFGIALPLVIFGGFALAAALLSVFLPETKNTSLPQTIEQAEDLGLDTMVNSDEITVTNDKITVDGIKESSSFL